MAKADLIAKAQELGLQLTGAETAPQLKELIKNATPPKTTSETVDNEQVVKNGVVGEFAGYRPDETPKTSFDIIGEGGGLVRTYSFEVHGENAEALANEFVSGHPGTKIA